MLARAGLGACPVGSLGWLSPDVCVQTPPWTYWAWSPGAGFGAQDSDRLFRGFGGPAQPPAPPIVVSGEAHLQGVSSVQAVCSILGLEIAPSPEHADSFVRGGPSDIEVNRQGSAPVFLFF